MSKCLTRPQNSALNSLNICLDQNVCWELWCGTNLLYSSTTSLVSSLTLRSRLSNNENSLLLASLTSVLYLRINASSSSEEVTVRRTQLASRHGLVVMKWRVSQWWTSSTINQLQTGFITLHFQSRPLSKPTLHCPYQDNSYLWITASAVHLAYIL